MRHWFYVPQTAYIIIQFPVWNSVLPHRWEKTICDTDQGRAVVVGVGCLAARLQREGIVGSRAEEAAAEAAGALQGAVGAPESK